MTKAELVKKMAEDAKVSKIAAGKALDSFMNSVAYALKKKDGKVALVSFGTFIKLRGYNRRFFYSNYRLPSKFITFNVAIKHLRKFKFVTLVLRMLKKCETTSCYTY